MSLLQRLMCAAPKMTPLSPAIRWNAPSWNGRFVHICSSPLRAEIVSKIQKPDTHRRAFSSQNPPKTPSTTKPSALFLTLLVGAGLGAFAYDQIAKQDAGSVKTILRSHAPRSIEETCTLIKESWEKIDESEKEKLIQEILANPRLRKTLAQMIATGKLPEVEEFMLQAPLSQNKAMLDFVEIVLTDSIGRFSDLKFATSKKEEQDKGMKWFFYFNKNQTECFRTLVRKLVQSNMLTPLLNLSERFFSFDELSHILPALLNSSCGTDYLRYIDHDGSLARSLRSLPEEQIKALCRSMNSFERWRDGLNMLRKIIKDEKQLEAIGICYLRFESAESWDEHG
jgi:hypothetical protein